MKNQGTLSARRILELMPKFISADQKGNVNQASIDLAISPEVYRVDNVFLPRPDESVRSILKNAKKWKHQLGQPMYRGQTYIAKVAGSLNLPTSVYGYANPKSSLGRTDTHIRLMADGVARYDCIPKGWKGELWILIQPISFHIVISVGERLNQVRFFTADTRFDEVELEVSMKNDKLLWDERKRKVIPYEDIKISDKDGSIILLIDLVSDIVGYRAINTETPLVLSERDADPWEFFQVIERPKCGRLALDRWGFYILSTLEAVRVPPTLSCEMVSMDDRAGEFRSHYAGYIDPGWGYGKDGEGKGHPITLEVRPFEKLLIRENQAIAKIRFERMIEPAAAYDATSTSNYSKQVGPTLGKFWKKR